MNLILNNEHNKKKCQKFTPLKEVNDMLDLAGYTHNLLGKSVLEYSFGSGNIIKQIVKRYIEDALENNFPAIVISNGLSTDIFGLEIDKSLFKQCIHDLDDIVLSYGIPNVKWSLICDDTLRWTTAKRFDFIIGNPPYLSYRDIDKKNREFIRKNFTTCQKGKFDYCYAFIEKGIDLLSPGGKMVQLIPSNIYKNVYANALRRKLLPGVSTIWEYPDSQLFEATLTSSSILVYENKNNINTISYKPSPKKDSIQINKSILKDKWVFYVDLVNHTEKVRFGDRYRASIAVATQLNKAFVLRDNNDIEPGCLKKAAAPRSLRKNKPEQIIFPYFFDDENNLSRYDEKTFQTHFPNAYQHLKRFEKELKKRDSDKSAKWFEYGRSQALRHLNQEKLLLSTVVTNSVEVYKLSKEEIPYSGIYITVCDDKSDLNKALSILRSDSFLQYIINQGLNVNGKSKRITCDDINDYQFEEN